MEEIHLFKKSTALTGPIARIANSQESVSNVQATGRNQYHCSNWQADASDACMKITKLFFVL